MFCVDCCVSHGVLWLLLLVSVLCHSLVVAPRSQFVGYFCLSDDCCRLVVRVVCLCVLPVVCDVSILVCLLLFVVRCVLVVVGWSSSVVRCWLFVACC